MHEIKKGNDTLVEMARVTGLEPLDVVHDLKELENLGVVYLESKEGGRQRYVIDEEAVSDRLKARDRELHDSMAKRNEEAPD